MTPNPKYLYESRTHREAKSSVIVGLECGVGFQVLTAPPGMGKTTILFSVLERFQQVARTAFFFQLQENPVDLERESAYPSGPNSGASSFEAAAAVNETVRSEDSVTPDIASAPEIVLPAHAAYEIGNASNEFPSAGEGSDAPSKVFSTFKEVASEPVPPIEELTPISSSDVSSQARKPANKRSRTGAQHQ